jgi:two-component system LytT family sensor kinase
MPTSGNSRIARKLAIMATALGLWGALVLLFAAPIALTSSISWRRAVAYGFSFLALWLFFLPVVAWLSFRFPIERRRIVRNLALHLFACLLVAGTSRLTFRVVRETVPIVMRSMAPQPPGFRVAMDVLLYWSLLGVCQAITNFRSSQERERRAAELEARLTSAQLQALRMQINPHFLFNTLNSIAALVYVNPRAADEMLGDLSQLLRRSLDSIEDQEIPLSQELEFIGAYLSIEQKRFGERLRLEQSVPDELMKALVPALILQPLVENAIRHGIEPQRNPGLISIEAKQQNNHLHLIVRDNGKGFPPAHSHNSGRHGIGLANTKARLQALYGQNQNFSVAKAEPQGCQIEIQLPFHLEPQMPQSGANEHQ